MGARTGFSSHPVSQALPLAPSSLGGLPRVSPAQPGLMKQKKELPLHAPPTPQTPRSSRAAGFCVFSKHFYGTYSFPVLLNSFRNIKAFRQMPTASHYSNLGR